MYMVTVRNPISNAIIREVEFSTIPELNAYLDYLATVKLYSFTVGKKTFRRNANWLKIAA